MKKITFLLTLLLSFVGVGSAWAQTFHVSDAPSDGNWATNTYWYTIQNASLGGWVSTTNKDDNGLKLNTTTLSNNDNEKWCVVGNETDGYRFYNKAEGTGKVLGLTNTNNNDTYGSSRAKMVEYTSSSVSSTADGEVGFTFLRMTSSYNSSYEAFKLAGIDGNYQRYLNERGGYLSYWNHNNVAQGTHKGSSFLFVPTDEFEKALLETKTKLDAAAAVIGVPFGYTQESYDAALAIYNQYKDKDQTTIGDQRDVAIAALNGITFQTMGITDGMQVYISNLQHNLYVFAKETNRNSVGGGWLGSSAAKDSYRYLFTIKAADGDKYKIYSNYYGKYVGSVPSSNNLEYQLVDESNAQAFNIVAASTAGYCNIYDENTTTTSGGVVVNAWHMVNWNNNPAGNGVVRWEKSANASTFKLNPITTDITAAWDATIAKKASNTNNYVGYKKYTSEVASALAAFQSATGDAKITASKALDEALAASTTVKPEAGKYYTIESAGNAGKFIQENYTTQTAGGENQLTAAEKTANVVPALWKFEQLTAENKTDLYHIIAANSGKCMSKAAYGYTMHVTDADNANVGEFDLFNTDHVSKDLAVTLVTYANTNRTDRGTASLSGTIINSWNAIDNNNNWRIQEATEIPVQITSAGYATLNLPFAVTIASGVKAYTATDGDTEITLSEVSGTIPANTPVILVANEGSYTFAIDYDNTTAAISSALNGTLVPTAVAADATAYILKNGTSGIGMYKITSDTDRTIGANKAYMGSTTASSEAAMKSFNFGTVEGINHIGINAETENAAYYDLNGRRVLYPAHGVFVKGNGQKVYIK